MDETDGYSTTEQEINGDEADASFPESGAFCVAPMEDDEETGDDEPSLGFQAGDIFVGRGCESGGSWHDDREVEDEHDEDNNDREGDELEHGGDEHDGCEPDEDGEPSLGWPEAYGCGGAGMGSSDDYEEGPGADVAAAQKRGRSDNPGVSFNRLYSGTRQITGLTAQQKQALGTEWVRR
jgi:hypothetical protein